MRKSAVILVATLAFAACNKDATAPSSDLTLLNDAAQLAFSSSFVNDPGSNFLGFLHRFPDNLKLSSDQQAQIKSLMDAFQTAAKADHDALAAIMRQAKAAADAGKSRDEVKAILDQATPIRQRLQTAETKLRADILGVLTPAQRAWLESRQPRPCSASALTDSQKAEISTLIAAFDQANRADLEAIRTAFEQARTAHQNGARREDVKKILDGAKSAMERVRAAQTALNAAVQAVLTPEQRASGCFKFGHR